MRGIFTGDLHLRGIAPRCRDESTWYGVQKDCLAEVVKFANEFKCPLYILGDIFHTPRPATHIINLFLSEMKKCEFPVYVMAGNHDLLFHSWDNVEESGYGIVRHALTEIGSPGCPVVGKPFDQETDEDRKLKVEAMATHQLTYPDAKSQPMHGTDRVSGKIAADLLIEYPGVQWIFTGDYHHNFIHTDGDRHVLNAGCMNRQAADMIAYKPVFYVVDTDTHMILNYPYPDTSTDDITDDYLEESAERDARLDDMLLQFEKGEGLTLCIKTNLKNALLKCETDEINEMPDSARAEVRSVITELEQETKG